MRGLFDIGHNLICFFLIHNFLRAFPIDWLYIGFGGEVSRSKVLQSFSQY